MSRRQLLGLGVGAGAIDHWVRCGRLHVVQRGVYLLGHTAAHPRAAEMAAVLACRRPAAISHRSAAFVWGLLRDVARPEPIELTVAGGARPSRRGLLVHRVRELPASDVRRVGEIPVLHPARTILDLAAAGPAALVESCLAEAEVRRLVTRRSMLRLVERETGRAGTRLLRRLLDEGPSLTRSEAEALLLDLVRRGGLPTPRTNVRLGRFRVDALWPRRRLVAEIDGFRFHGGRRAFERDRRRDAELAAGGYLVVRVTWRQLVDGPEGVLVRLAQALAARADVAA